VGLTTIILPLTRLMPTLLFKVFLITAAVLRCVRSLCAPIWIF